MLAEFRHIVECRRRVFNVGDVEWLELSQRLARRVERPGVVRIEAQGGIQTDGGAHLLHHLDLGIQVQHTHFALEDRRAMLLAHLGAVPSYLQRRGHTWLGRAW